MGREEGNPNRLEFVIDIKSIIFAIKEKKLGIMATTVKTTTTFRLDKGLLDMIKAKAKAANRSLNNYVECLLMADVECSPNEETLQAMRDAEEGKNLEKVGKAEDLMKLLE